MEEIEISKQWVAKARNDLATLTPYAVEIRYPDDLFMPSEEDAREARNAAGRVLMWLQRALPDAFTLSRQ